MERQSTQTDSCQNPSSHTHPRSSEMSSSMGATASSLGISSPASFASFSTSSAFSSSFALMAFRSAWLICLHSLSGQRSLNCSIGLPLQPLVFRTRGAQTHPESFFFGRGTCTAKLVPLFPVCLSPLPCVLSHGTVSLHRTNLAKTIPRDGASTSGQDP
jgi:hypothetical protein